MSQNSDEAEDTKSLLEINTDTQRVVYSSPGSLGKSNITNFVPRCIGCLATNSMVNEKRHHRSSCY